MLKRRKLLLLLICLGCVAVAVFLFRTKEPSFEGHTLSDWVAAYAKPETKSQSDQKIEATAAIRHIGTNSIPYLLEWLRYEQPPGKPERLKKLSKPLVWLNNYFGAKGSWALKDREWDRAEDTVLAFGALGPNAKEAVPELSRLLNAPKNRFGAIRAGHALAIIPEFGLPVLAAALTNAEPHIRGRAALSMAYLGTNGNPVIPMLIQVLDDEDRQVTYCASDALRGLHPKGDLAVPGLIKCLQSTNAVCRAAAAQVLGVLRQDAMPAVPSLITALGDTDENSQRVATDALVDIAPNAMTNDSVFVTATNALHSPHAHLRIWATYALRNFGSRAQSEVTSLRACLLDTDVTVRYSATNALLKIAPELFTTNWAR
jgi:hypothetical protein